MRTLFCFFAIAMAGMFAACYKPAETPVAPDAGTPEPLAATPSASTPEPALTPPPATAPASAGDAATAVELPEGFKARFHVHPEMKLTSAQTIDEASGQYKVAGELRAGTLGVLDYYVKYFRDNGWEEDAIMDLEGTTVVSFKKDGYLQYVDAREGGIGSRITITTGRE